MAEREGICLTSMMLLVGLGMSQYSSTTKADIFLSIGLLVGRECISIDYQPAPEVTRANTENKGSDRTLEEESMDTTTLILVIIGAFTVSNWFMRLVDYLEGGNKRV